MRQPCELELLVRELKVFTGDLTFWFRNTRISHTLPHRGLCQRQSNEDRRTKKKKKKKEIHTRILYGLMSSPNDVGAFGSGVVMITTGQETESKMRKE